MLSIDDSEWPARDAALRAWLAAENFMPTDSRSKRLEDFVSFSSLNPLPQGGAYSYRRTGAVLAT
jgi:hypothetical protein